MFNLTKNDLKSACSTSSDKALIKRVVSGKQNSLKRRTKKSLEEAKLSEKGKVEVKRKKEVEKTRSRADSLSSSMNLCQALVRPDLSKPRISKSTTVKIAIKSLIRKLQHNEMLEYSSLKHVPAEKRAQIVACVTEFSGQKYKTSKTPGASIGFMMLLAPYFL